MAELKVQCDCGQKFKFDVEPVNNRMPFTVNCPVCGADGTSKANDLLQRQAPPPKAAIAPPPVPSQLRVAPAVTAPPEPPHVPAAASTPRPPPSVARAASRSSSTSNLGMGALGALLGAAVGAGLMYGFFALTQFRFPLMGTGVGALTGLGARILYRGTDSALGAISGGIAAAAVVGTLYAMFGEFPVMNIISVVVSVSIAYRIAA
jgi:hypothetical protein